MMWLGSRLSMVSPFLFLLPCYSGFFIFRSWFSCFGLTAWLEASQFLNQGLNPGRGSESLEP